MFVAIEETRKRAVSVRMLELTNRFGLDLANAFSSNREDLPDFFQCVRISVGQAVSQSQDLSLTVVKVFHRLFDP